MSIVQTLVDLPEHLRGQLLVVARDGNDEHLWKWLREAARFGPYPPVLYRYCPQGTTLGGRVRVPPGALVLAAIHAAARDPQAVEKPRAFRPDRPDDHYLLFGAGQHHCVGATPERDVAQVLLVEMARPLLKLPALRRAPRPAGRVASAPRGASYPGNPVSLFLDFDD